MEAGWKPTKRFWGAYGALYGDGRVDTITPPKKKSPQRSILPTEDQEQAVVAVWLSKMSILYFHIPNGGYRNYLEAAKLKRLGVKAGLPDICIPVARKGYHGLYGELKRQRGGVISDAQKYWLEELRKQGYYVFVAKGADEFIQHVKFYMEIQNDTGSAIQSSASTSHENRNEQGGRTCTTPRL